MMKMDRRTYLRNIGNLVAGITTGLPYLDASVGRKFQIGACDWTLGQRAKLEAFDIGKEIGLDGVQISYRDNADQDWLSRREIQKAYREKASALNMSVASLALGILNQVPYKSDDRAEEWVLDSIDVAQNMGVGIILLAFFGDGDIKDDPEGTKVVVERLTVAAKKAEQANVILGLETWLSAKEHMAIIDAVGSDHIKVYYDVANSHKMGYDIYEEIRWLGKEQICELHAKENGYLLGKGLVDFKEVRKAVRDIEYEGWIQIEGAIPKGAEIVASHKKNEQVLRKLF